MWMEDLSGRPIQLTKAEWLWETRIILLPSPICDNTKPWCSNSTNFATSVHENRRIWGGITKVYYYYGTTVIIIGVGVCGQMRHRNLKHDVKQLEKGNKRSGNQRSENELLLQGSYLESSLWSWVWSSLQLSVWSSLWLSLWQAQCLRSSPLSSLQKARHSQRSDANSVHIFNMAKQFAILQGKGVRIFGVPVAIILACGPEVCLNYSDKMGQSSGRGSVNLSRKTLAKLFRIWRILLNFYYLAARYEE